MRPTTQYSMRVRRLPTEEDRAGAPLPRGQPMSGRSCVSEQDLRAFLLGDLPAGRAREVTRHLEGCST